MPLTINTGVPGWGLNQYYLFLKRTGAQFSPDVVVLAYFVDDLRGPIQDSLPPATQYQSGLRVKGGVLHHSSLFNFIKSISDMVRDKNRPARVGYLHDLDIRRAEWARRVNYLMSESTPGETEQYSGMLREHLQRLEALSSTIRTQMVLIYVPDISQLHHPEAQLVNRILLKLCRERSIPFVDMTAIFERSPDPGRYYLWPDDAHTNVLGHLEMAVALERLICEMPRKVITCAAS